MQHINAIASSHMTLSEFQALFKQLLIMCWTGTNLNANRNNIFLWPFHIDTKTQSPNAALVFIQNKHSIDTGKYPTTKLLGRVSTSLINAREQGDQRFKVLNSGALNYPPLPICTAQSRPMKAWLTHRRECIRVCVVSCLEVWDELSAPW